MEPSSSTSSSTPIGSFDSSCKAFEKTESIFTETFELDFEDADDLQYGRQTVLNLCVFLLASNSIEDVLRRYAIDHAPFVDVQVMHFCVISNHYLVYVVHVCMCIFLSIYVYW